MNRGNEYRTECGLMEYSEQVIYELQSILRDKVGDDRLPVIKKAMDIEDYLYRDALYKSGLDLTGNVWESSSAVNTYIESMENVKKLIKAKEDFGKLYPIADTRQFYLQLTSQRTTTNKKKDPGEVSAAAGKKEKAKPRSKPSQPAAKRKSKGANPKSAPAIPAPQSSGSPLQEFLSPQETIPPILKPDPLPVMMSENIDDPEEDLMGFGFSEDDIETTDTGMSNVAAWSSLPVSSSHETGGSEVGKSWTEAAEERRNQQKIKSSMELHRFSQQAELKKARERDPTNGLQHEQQQGEDDLEALREREKRKRESEVPELNLMQNFESLESLDEWA